MEADVHGSEHQTENSNERCNRDEETEEVHGHSHVAPTEPDMKTSTEATAVVKDPFPNNLEERLVKLETELNFMHGENDRLKADNAKQLDDAKKFFEKKILEMEEKLAQTLHQYGTKCEAYKSLEEDYSVKCNLIKSMEATQMSLRNLVADKDEVISSQATIIQSIQSKSTECDILRVENELLIEKQTVLEENNQQLRMIPNEIEALQQKHDVLQRKFDDQVRLTNDKEIALVSKDNQISAKEDLIQNLKTIMNQTSLPIPNNENIMTSNCEMAQHPACRVPGMQECIIKLEGISLHGIILDSFLTWVDMNRKTTARELWKEKALQNFTSEEITTAKDVLWEVCQESVIGKMTKRQGGSKQKSEIDDIANALDKLSENKILPIFLSTSNMILRTPSFVENNNISNFINIERKLQDINESLGKQAENMNKNRDKIISKCEVGNKKIDDISVWLTEVQKSKPHIKPMQHVTNFIEEKQNFEIINADEFVAKTHENRNLISKDTENTNSSDVIVVAKGIATHIKERHLINYLERQGMTVKNCQILTKHENPRALAFKVTINAQHYDESLWPPGVTVAPFKEKNAQISRASRNGISKNTKNVQWKDQDGWLRKPTNN